MPERLAPDAILASTNLSGSVAAIQDDPDAPDGSWLTAADTSADTSVRTSFPTPSGSLSGGAGLQEFRVQVRKAGGAGTPTASVELWKGGVLVSTVVAATSVTGPMVLSGTWDATGHAGADIECVVVGTGSGGKPADRSTVEVGAVEWNAEVVVAGSYDATFAGVVPLQSMAADVAHGAPTFDASFAGAMPLQGLAAQVDVAAPNNDRDASFAATVPLQGLRADVATEVPDFAVEFAGAVPVQSLTADVAFEQGASGDVSFSASVPVQALSADVGHTPPTDTVEFGAMAPMQTLAAGLAFEEAPSPDRSLSFAGTAPMQVLVATVGHAAPGFGIEVVGAIPVQVLVADVVKLTHSLAPEGRKVAIPPYVRSLVASVEKAGGADAEPRTVTVGP